jgi:hypothetical protein
MKTGVAGEIVYIVALPFALFFLSHISPINQAGYLDPYLYTGYINNFGDLFQRYGLTYYSVRFGLIGPALVLNKVLGPIAGYFAFCYAMVLVAGVPLYAVFRKYFSISAAVFAYSALISSAWFDRHVLWTHPDAAAVPYLLAGVSLMLLDLRPRKLWDFVIGALFSLAVNSNFFTIVVAGLTVVPYLIINRGRLRQVLLGDVVFGLLGFFGVYLAATLIYYAKLGIWKLHEPTLNMVAWGFAGNGDVYRVKPEQWVFSTLYAYFPIFLGMCYLLVIYRRKITSRIPHAIAGYALSVVLFFSWWQFASHGLIVELPYYFCYLIPALMPLAVVVPIMLVSEAPKDNARLILWTATGVTLAIPILVARFKINFEFNSFAQFCLLSVFAMFLLLVARKGMLTRLFAIAAYIIALNMYFLGYVTTPFDLRQANYAFQFRTDSRKAELDLYKITIEFMRSMPRFRDDHKKMLFWYSNAAENKFLSSVQSTYLWGYSRLQAMDIRNPGMPVLGDAELKLIDSLDAGHLVLMGLNQTDVQSGLAALDRKSVKYRLSNSKAICSGELCVHLAIVDLIPPDHAQNASAEFANLATLFKYSGKTLADKLEKNYYGQFTQNAIALHADGSFLFSPTSPRDHLATPFAPLVQPAEGGAAWLRLKLKFAATARPSLGCKILIQDSLLRTLFESDCVKSALNSDDQYFQVPPGVTKLRATIQSANQTPTYLPTEISLEQGLGTRHK